MSACLEEGAVPTLRAENAGAIEIHYEESGPAAGAAEAVVLVGGLTSTVETWGLQVPALAERYRVITFDNRGSGRTRVPADDGVRTPARLAGDVVALLDGLGLDRVHLVGASMGGMVVQEVALAHPRRLRSLVVACSTCGGPHAVRASDAVLQKMLRGSGGESAETLEVVAQPELFETRRERLDFYLETKRRWPHAPAEIARRAAGIARFDTWGRLPGLAVPTLVVCGADDVLVPAENSRILAARIPGAELVVIERTAHIFFVEEPERTNRALLAFLAKHGATALAPARARPGLRDRR
jgi:pimeloyl-ACP methyl ester carboxylesterase